MDHVDIYQIHRWDYAVPVEEFMEALHDVVKAGKARYIGASSMWAWREMMPLLRDQGVACVPWSPLARGFSPRKGPQSVRELEELVAGTELELTLEEVKRLEAPYQPKRILGHI